jgi:amidophosphoribosyltransferase
MDRFDDDKLHDECGVIGIYAPERDVARIAYFGLHALQHRGQESAGIASCDGRHAYVFKEMGLVSQVFNEDNLKPLIGTHAIGHNRYSTTGSSVVRNAGPYVFETIYGPLGVAHNGNLTNALQLRQRLLQRGVGLASTTDTELLTQIIAAPPEIWRDVHAQSNGASRAKVADIAHEDWWVARFQAMMGVVEGAYSLAVLTRNAIYAVRDPLGLRPLCLGELDDGYVIASESCALQTIGARYVREVEPGEILRLDQHGVASIMPKKHNAKRALCVFEHVYFARPDTMLEGQVIHDVRQRLGRQLAREAPVQADIVVGVPDSAIPAAIGYSLEADIPYSEGLIKNRYIGRTFIQPDQALRKIGVRLKYNPLSSNLRGKRVVMVDDSIVRGSTVGPLIQLLRDGGASEVHVRVSSPPVRHPCFMGVDMATYKELIAHTKDIAEICKYVGADSLAYLSVDGLLKATHGVEGALLNNDAAALLANGQSAYCAACFSGNYPIPIPKWLFEDDRDSALQEVQN